jgi:hypothetical protein
VSENSLKAPHPALSLWELTRVGIAGSHIKPNGVTFLALERNTVQNGFIPWFVLLARFSFLNEGLAPSGNESLALK